jgi:ABC-type amino acid transport substrate-binding protein
MKNILLVILAVVLALAVQNYVLAPKTSAPAKTETAYERVMRTNTLRCAYGIYPPWVMKDPNTGRLSGMMPDMLDAFSQATGIKVEWGPESDWGAIVAVLQSGKADAWCSSMYMTPKRSRVLTGTIPIFYSIVEAYVRPDDKRFDNTIDRINQPDVSISANSGDLSEEVAQRLFPKAQLVYKSPMGGEAELFLNVATNKADLTLSGPDNMSIYNESNPATALRKIEFEHPLMVFDGVIGLDIHEIQLQQMLNGTLQNMINNGAVDQILRKHLGKNYGVAYFPPKPQLP